MKHLLRAVLFVSIITMLSVGVFPVAAQIKTVDCNDFGVACGDSTTDVMDYVFGILEVFLGIIAVAAVIVIVYAGVQLVASQGDSKKMESAKHAILYAVIGLIIIGLAAAAVRFTATAINKGASSNAQPAQGGGGNVGGGI